MDFETIIIERRDRIGSITLNRPDKFNTFSTRLARELNTALEDLESDAEIRVVIVKGAGKVFSTGIDISEYPGKSPLEYHAWITQMDRMHLTIAAMKKPVIAMAHGYAVANGAGLVAAADFAVISSETKIGTTAINVGLLCTGPIIPMSDGLGKKKTLEMLLCGEMIDAEEAMRLGLVNKVVPPDKLEEETLRLATNLAGKSPVALGMGKEFYYKMIDMPFRQRMAYNAEVFARLCATEDAAEGVSAFTEKRKPQWSGR